MSFVVFNNGAGQTELLALHALADAPLREAYRVPVPADLMLFCDGAGRRVTAVYGRAAQLQTMVLGPEPPRIAADAEPRRRWFALGRIHQCRAHRERSNEAALATRRDLLDCAGPGWPDEVLRRWEHSPVDKQIAMTQAVMLDGKYQLSETLLARLVKSHPDHIEVRLRQTEVALFREDWAEVCRLLEPVVAAQDQGAPGPLLQHAHHLLALALLFQGEGDRARRALEAAAALGGDCELGDLNALLRPLPDAEPPVDEHNLVLALRCAIVAAVRCLERGDWRGGCARLDTPLVWLAEEVQSLARLAQALLMAPPPQGAEVFVLARALSTFCAAAGNKPGPHELPLVTDRLSAAEIGALVTRAQKRLEELRNGEPGAVHMG